ncbi:MAG: VWA domain-containing protein [Bacteroidota bacterium]
MSLCGRLALLLLFLCGSFLVSDAQHLALANNQYSKGIAFLKRGKNQKALTYFKKALKEETRHDAACLMIIKIHLAKNQPKQATFYLDHLANIQATSNYRNLERNYYLAFNHILNSNHESARDLLKQTVVEMHKDQQLDYHLLARAYNALGYLDVVSNQEAKNGAKIRVNERHLRNARFLFEEALRYRPNSPVAATNYNRVNTALELPPNHIDPYPLHSTATAVTLSNPQLIAATQQAAIQEDWLPAKLHWMIDDFSDYDELLFMIDASGSMRVPSEMDARVSRFDWMKNLTYHILKSIREETKIGVVAVGGECGDRPPMQRSTSVARFRLFDLVKNLTADGQTPVNAAMELAPALFGNEKGRKAILFITDGMESCEPERTCELSAYLGQQGIEIHILSFLEESQAMNEYISYTCMAESTNGSLRGVDENGALEQRDFQYSVDDGLIIPELEKKSDNTQGIAVR